MLKTGLQVLVSVLLSIAQWVFIYICLGKYGAAMFGKYAFVMAVCAPLFMLFDLKLRNIISNDVDHEFHYSLIRNLKYVALCFCLVVSVVVLTNRAEFSLLALAVLAIKLNESVSNYGYGYWQRNKTEYRIILSTVIRSALIASVFVWNLLGFDFQDSLKIIALLSMAHCFSTLVWLELDFKADLPSSKSTAMLLPSLLKLGITLGVVQFVLSLRFNIPVYFAQDKLDAAGVGIYSSLAYVIVALSRPNMALFNARLTTMTELIKNGNFRKVAMLYLESICLVILLSSTVWFAVRITNGDILTMLLSDELLPYVNVFQVLIIGAPFLYFSTYVVHSLIALGQSYTQLVLSVVSCIILVVTMSFRLKDNSLLQLAEAVILSQIIFCVLSSISVFRSLSIRSRKAE